IALPVASTTTSSSLVRPRAKPSSPDRVMSTRPCCRSRPSSQTTTSARVRWMSIPITRLMRLPSVRGRGSGGRHDNYGSALAARPGGSQGRPATNSSSRPVEWIGLPTLRAPGAPQPGWSHHTRGSRDPHRLQQRHEHHASYRPSGTAEQDGISRPARPRWTCRHPGLTLAPAIVPWGEAIMIYVGLDVSIGRTAVCVVDAAGRVIGERSVASTPEAIAAVIKAAGTEEVARVGLEAGLNSAFLARGLLAAGLPAIVIAATHAAAALRTGFRNKTDKNDARGIADLMRVDKFRSVWVKSTAAQRDRALLTVREQLRRRSLDARNTIWSILQAEGLQPPRLVSAPFGALVTQM